MDGNDDDDVSHQTERIHGQPGTGIKGKQDLRAVRYAESADTAGTDL